MIVQTMTIMILILINSLKQNEQMKKQINSINIFYQIKVIMILINNQRWWFSIFVSYMNHGKDSGNKYQHYSYDGNDKLRNCNKNIWDTFSNAKL